MADAIVGFEGWSASGVGWGEQGWGVGKTDVTATGQIGSVTFIGSATVTPSGVVAVGLIGQINIWGPINDYQNANWQSVLT